MISLYLVGTWLTEDFGKTSDIEIFGIVSENFDESIQDKINEYFKTHPKVCGNRRGSFYAFFISNFMDKTKKRTELSPDDTWDRFWLRYFPFYRHIFGKKIEGEKLPLKPLDFLSELKIDLNYTKGGVEYAKSHNYAQDKDMQFRFPTFIKNVFHCARVEYALDTGKYVLGYTKFTNEIKKDENNIVHECLRLRKLGSIVEAPESLELRRTL